MKTWNKEPTDITQFTITRQQWHTLLEAIAGNAAWVRDTNRGKLFDALDVLRNAEEDVETSAMIQALQAIAEYTKRGKSDTETNIHAIAKKGLAALETQA